MSSLLQQHKTSCLGEPRYLNIRQLTSTSRWTQHQPTPVWNRKRGQAFLPHSTAWSARPTELPAERRERARHRPLRVGRNGEPRLEQRLEDEPAEDRARGEAGHDVRIDERRNAHSLGGGADEMARKVAMHIAASAPQWIGREDVPQDIVTAEREIYSNSDEVQSKPEQARAKIVEGMLNEDRKMLAAVQREKDRIAVGIEIITQALRRKGRIIFVGAGTSGRRSHCRRRP